MTRPITFMRLFSEIDVRTSELSKYAELHDSDRGVDTAAAKSGERGGSSS